MKTCFRCKQTKPKSEFYRDRSKGANGHSRECKLCTNARTKHHQTTSLYQHKYQAKYKKEVKAFKDNLKSEGCALCGYDKCSHALHYHHLESKDRAISRIQSSISAVKREIGKCILVCANCHAEIHAGMHERILDPQVSPSPTLTPKQASLYDQE